MSIIILPKDKELFLALIAHIQHLPDVDPMDWDSLAAEVRSGEMPIEDWVKLHRRSFASLTDPLRRIAEQLLHQVRWFAPMANAVDAQNTATLPVDPNIAMLKKLSLDGGFIEGANVMVELTEFRKLAKELGASHPSVQAFLNSEGFPRRYIFFSIIDEIYNIEISEGTFANDGWSRAREIIRAIGEDGAAGANRFAERQVNVSEPEYLQQVLPYLLFVSTKHPDPFARFYALRLIDETNFVRLGKPAHFSLFNDVLMPSEDVMKLFGVALKDKEPLIALTAWQAIYRLNPFLAKGLSAKNFSTEGPGPDFRLFPHDLGSERYWAAEDMFLEDWGFTKPAPPAYFSITDFFPLHNLRDFASRLSIRQYVMADKLKYLKSLVEEYGLEQKELIMKLFLKNPPKDGNIKEAAFVLKLPSGRLVLMQALHRFAAFILAPTKKIIPEKWLLEIPLDVDLYVGPVPAALADIVMGRGKWPDIFPDGTELPEILRKGRQGGQGNSPPMLKNPPTLPTPAPTVPPAPAAPAPPSGSAAPKLPTSKAMFAAVAAEKDLQIAAGEAQMWNSAAIYANSGAPEAPVF